MESAPFPCSLCESFPSLGPFYKALSKFVNKHKETWFMQMRLSSSIPTTSNSIECKNSIVRRFSSRIKAFFDVVSLESFFSAVAL